MHARGRLTPIMLAQIMLALGAAISGAGAAPAFAQELPPGDLATSLAAAAEARAESEARAGEIARERAAAAERLDALRRELVIAAYAVQDAETVVAALESRIETTRAELAALRPRLATMQAQLFRSVLALHRVASDSLLARLAAGEDPNQVVRAGLVMAALSPALRADAEAAAARMQALHGLEDRLEAQRADVARARDDLVAERARIDGLRAEVDRLYADQSAALSAEHARAEALGREVDSLAGLIAALRQAAAVAPQVTIEIAPPPAPGESADGATAPARPQRGTAVLPVRGGVVSGFGAAEAGVRSGGVRLAAVAGAQVVSPLPGSVAYAAPFPGRDLVLIIDHGGGYHSVLMGLARIDTAVGRQLLAGEPVGILGGLSDTTPDGAAGTGMTPDTASARDAISGVVPGTDMQRDAASAATGLGGAELYYELRRNGTPIDPMPWFSTVSDRIDG